MSTRVLIQEPIPEGASILIEGTLQDEDGVGLPAASLYTLQLTLFDKRTRTIINSRSHQNVLNTNGGSVNSVGLMRLQLVAIDAVLQSQNLTREQHIALIEWTWASGARGGKLEVEFTIRNLTKVT